jgi:tripartite-type tricarboxylate transporter receptor subunit TctC
MHSAGSYALVAWLAGLSIAGSAQGQNWPNKAVRIVVPFAAGGPTDMAARLHSDKLGEKLRVPVVVDNKPSGNGAIAFQAMLSGPPDGYTLMFGTAGYVTVSPAVSKTPVIDPLKDLAPIVLAAKFNDLLVVSNDLPVKTLRELIDYGRKNPGKLSYGSAGIGSFNHLLGEYFAFVTGINMVHVPYKGTGPFLTDIAGGRLSMGFATMEGSLPLARAGKVRALGLGSPPAPGQPEYGYPTIADAAGLPGFDFATWGGYLGPAGMPREVIRRVNEIVNETIRQPDVLQRYRDVGFEAVANTPEEFSQFLAQDLNRWRDIARRGNITIN